MQVHTENRRDEGTGRYARGGEGGFQFVNDEAVALGVEDDVHDGLGGCDVGG